MITYIGHLMCSIDKNKIENKMMMTSLLYIHIT